LLLRQTRTCAALRLMPLLQCGNFGCDHRALALR
jgi:hypothetical protein